MAIQRQIQEKYKGTVSKMLFPWTIRKLIHL